MYTNVAMDPQPYIPGLSPAEPGPLSRFMPPLEEGVVSAWLAQHAQPGTWLLDPFGFAPRLALEAARAGHRLLVTANNPITRFLLEMAADPPPESDFKAALADLAVSKKGDERLEAHLQSLYLTKCERCGREIQAEAFLWRKAEAAPYARLYTCRHCADSGERSVTAEDVERARRIAATDVLHRARTLERVAPLDDQDRQYAEDALQHYLPRPLYVLTTVINRLDGLNLAPERRRALTALILVACDAGNTLWGHPAERPRPKQLHTPNQFREDNLWLMLERGLTLWSETGSGVPYAAWPNKIPEGGICIFEGRLRDLAHQVRKEIPIAAVVGSLPRPNQAFWTLSALWAGWLWGREAVEPFKVALRRRRYDWGWNATAFHSAFAHLFELLPLGTPFLGFLPEPEPPFLTSALTAANAAGFDLQGLALRTQHDPVQIVWRRGEHLRREADPPDIDSLCQAMHAHLLERGEPASYLHIHTAGLVSLSESHALMQSPEFDEALRSTASLLHSALSEDPRFIHYSTGESVDTGLWGLSPDVSLSEAKNLAPDKGAIPIAANALGDYSDSLADRVEVATVTYLQNNPHSIYLEIEEHLYPDFPGLLTPSKAMIYAVLYSYAEKDGAAWSLRPEDEAAARRAEVKQIAAAIEAIGRRLQYGTRKEEQLVLWQEKNAPPRAFYVLASALIGRAIAQTLYPAAQTFIVIPGGRAALAAYKAQRDPALAERMRPYRLVKYRLLRSLSEMSILTRETFEEQLASDPIEQARGQMMMF